MLNPNRSNTFEELGIFGCNSSFRYAEMPDIVELKDMEQWRMMDSVRDLAVDREDQERAMFEDHMPGQGQRRQAIIPSVRHVPE
ncbi:hypothetical protein RB195_020302 [Necator americanus]|uniref:Uncharacterized protein n=1 Tax=Necator americanus TaxID=51031 RepID=A0ABR1CJ42_NECAM